MALQIHQIDELERGFMSRLQYNIRRMAVFKGFLPTGGAEAPLVTRDEAGEFELRARRAQVVSTEF